MSKLEVAKQIIRKYYKDADCGLIRSRNVLDNWLLTLYHKDGLTINICYDYRYFEVFGLSDDEFNELEKYYDCLLSGGKQ